MTTNANGEEPVSIMFAHCRAVYDKLNDTAKPVDNGDGDIMLVWEGKLTQVFRDLNMSAPYYTSVRRRLLEMRCVEQLRRGGGNTDSQWRLLTEPTEEAFREALRLPSTKQPKTATAMHEQQLRAHEERITELESIVEQLVARG